MFIPKHALLILNYEIYHLKLLVYITKFWLRKKSLVELCVGNYETSDGLVNGANGIFENFTKIISNSFVWIHFHNPQIGHNKKIKNLQIYDEFPRLDKQ
jgi:hypothetical protein